MKADNELVTLNKFSNTIMTNSLIVAETYRRRHSNVLRDIEAIIKEIKTLEEQEELPTQLKIEFSEYTDESGKTNKMYLLDRNAWTMLVMGYNGSNATRFKLRYIAAFDSMEAQLMKIAELQIADAKETISLLESQKSQMEDNIRRRFTLTEAARHLGIGVNEMTRALRERGFFKKIKRNNNEPLDYLKEGKLFIVEEGYQNSKMESPSRQTYVTWHGIQWIKNVLSDILVEKGIIYQSDVGYDNDW